MPFVDSFDALLKSPSFVQWFKPDLVLQIGRTLTSGAWERFLGQHDEIDHQVIASHGWHDPASTANGLLFGDLDAALSGLLELLPRIRERGSWLDDLGSFDHLALDLAEKELATSAQLSEGSVARSVAQALPNGALLVVGNSLPIRQLDTWGLRRGGVGVVSQRGASGIDGLVAGSAGSALAHGGPTLLLLGDVSFLHDLSGLESVLQVSTPLVLVVVQNRGGRIFEQLPVARHPEVPSAQLSHWFTPHEGDFEGAARLHGLPFYRTDSLSGLQKALHKALDHPRASVVEAIVPPHGAAEQGRRLVEKVEEAVAGFLDR